jgi:polyketide cyclase/dehydrase/lipid transport protein
MSGALLRALLVLCLAAGSHASAADVSVAATRDGDVLVIEASAEFDGTVAQTWQVLTDYDNLAKFIPNLTSSRVTARSAEGITVEQKGEARLLVFSFPIDVRLAVSESPPTRVISRAVAGNFREMSGSYVVDERQGRIRLRYSGRMVPGFFVPPLIGTWVLRHNVETTFNALVDEIVRRQNAH